MVRFCGVFVSDSRHLKCAVAEVLPILERAVGSGRLRLGVGSYSGDEVLLTRRPTSGPGLPVLNLLEPAVGNHVLIGLDDAIGVQFRLEATPPFRFRNYLGLWTVGSIHRKEFSERVMFNMPEYLARDVRSDSPGEWMFHLFLSYLHDMGRLDARSVRPETLVEALRSTFLLFPKLVEVEPGEKVPPLATCISNGEVLMTATVGFPLWMTSRKGIEACPVCSDPVRTPEHDARVVAHPDTRVAVFLMTGSDEAPEGFAAVPDGQVLVVTGTGELMSRAI